MSAGRPAGPARERAGLPQGRIPQCAARRYTREQVRALACATQPGRLASDAPANAKIRCCRPHRLTIKGVIQFASVRPAASQCCGRMQAGRLRRCCPFRQPRRCRCFRCFRRPPPWAAFRPTRGHCAEWGLVDHGGHRGVSCGPSRHLRRQRGWVRAPAAPWANHRGCCSTPFGWRATVPRRPPPWRPIARLQRPGR